MFEVIQEAIEWTALVIELLAVSVIVVGVVLVVVRFGTIRYVFQLGDPGALARYKQQLGRPLLLGLELLVAADVIRTVALEPPWPTSGARPAGAGTHRLELVVVGGDGRPVAVAGPQDPSGS